MSSYSWPPFSILLEQFESLEAELLPDVRELLNMAEETGGDADHRCTPDRAGLDAGKEEGGCR